MSTAITDKGLISGEMNHKDLLQHLRQFREYIAETRSSSSTLR